MFEGRPDRSAEIVFAGRSNVGKSTVMRELTGHSFATGRSPGVTRSPNFYDWESEDFLLTDLPGFGFMEGVSADRRETIKSDVVRYIESYASEILVGVIVLDGKSCVDIIDRHEAQGDVPYDLDMYRFFIDVGIPTVLAVNKMDKVSDRDETLNAIAERFGMPPPWRQWQDVIAPISAKRGQLDALETVIRQHLRDHHRDDLLKFF